MEYTFTKHEKLEAVQREIDRRLAQAQQQPDEIAVMLAIAADYMASIAKDNAK